MNYTRRNELVLYKNTKTTNNLLDLNRLAQIKLKKEIRQAKRARWRNCSKNIKKKTHRISRFEESVVQITKLSCSLMLLERWMCATNSRETLKWDALMWNGLILTNNTKGYELGSTTSQESLWRMHKIKPRFRYVEWRPIEMVFIPKSGRSCQCKPKNCRPIIVSHPYFWTRFHIFSLEQVWTTVRFFYSGYVRARVGLWTREFVSKAQHAFIKGRA